MLPVEHHRGLSDHESKVELSIVLTNAVVRSGAENQVVLGSLFLSISNIVSVGIEFLGVIIDIGVMEGEVGRRNEHGACEND